MAAGAQDPGDLAGRRPRVDDRDQVEVVVGEGQRRGPPTLKATRPSGSSPTRAVAARIAASESVDAADPGAPGTRGRGRGPPSPSPQPICRTRSGGADQRGPRRRAESAVADSSIASDRNSLYSRLAPMEGTDRQTLDHPRRLRARRGRGRRRDPDLAQRRRRRARRPPRRPAPTAASKSKRREPKQVSLQGPEDDDRRRAKKLTAVVETSCGSFDIALDTERAPKTANSFAYLAEEGFYDDLTFHRIVPEFVIQGGDPAGTGAGGPGYNVVEKPPANLAYTKGVVAMAKTSAEPPGTSGSQFYVVTGADAGLPPEYALVGKVSEGLDVVELIGELGKPDEKPKQPDRDRNDDDRAGLDRSPVSSVGGQGRRRRPAPDFELPGTGGKTYRLADYRGRKLILAFYPGDFTPSARSSSAPTATRASGSTGSAPRCSGSHRNRSTRTSASPRRSD